MNIIVDTSDPESDDLLQVITRPNRPKSTSEQIIPSDDDTDIDYDNVYATGKLPQNHIKSPVLKSKNNKLIKQKSQYAPLEKHQKQMKKIYIIATILCIAIIALLLFFMIHFNAFNVFTHPTNSKPNITNAPRNISSTTTKSPTYIPTISPTNFPSQNPSTNPTQSPSLNPTITPSITPTKFPTQFPSFFPTITPTQTPSINPSIFPTQNPTNSPTKIPTQTPTISPTKNPSLFTKTPTTSPTPSPITTIQQSGNEIYDQGITMNFPKNAFPDTILTIHIGEARPTTLQLFDDTTTGFQAMSIHNITNNAIHFIVENNPLQIMSNISYKTTIPIPTDLLRHCPGDYGYEIFTQIQQNIHQNSIFVLFESLYNPTAQSLTTWLFPEMFVNKSADIILSCTPGKNIVPVRRLRRNLFDVAVCKAAEIICPVAGGTCVILNPFGGGHYGVDYASMNSNIISAANGMVERSGFSPVYGNVIIIRNEDGSATIYADLNEKLVFVGDQIGQGEVIGIGGSVFFHFEYIANGEIYQTKKRINPNDCLAPTSAPSVSGGVGGSGGPTLRPTKSPLVPPDTHSPTPAPTLVTGSITVRDSGQLADDSFAVYIDGFKVCVTEIGALNTCAISFLRPGLHTLTLEVLIAPDKFGTFYVALSNGWEFTDGTNTTTFEDNNTTELFPPGWRGSWNFIVPFPTLNINVPP